jgi:hypothetical protein
VGLGLAKVGAAGTCRGAKTGGISGSDSSSESVISVNSPSSSNQDVWVGGGIDFGSSGKEEREKRQKALQYHKLLL